MAHEKSSWGALSGIGEEDPLSPPEKADRGGKPPDPHS